MNKQIYKNITRFSLPIIIKTVDGTKSFSFTLPPQKKFEISEVQITGDVKVKVKNKLLQFVSEQPETSSTTEFLKVPVPIPVKQDIKTKSVKSSTFISNKETKFVTKEIDNS